MNPTLVEVHDRIVTLTLNRPDKLNALVPEMAEGFREALRKASEPGVKALVLRGEGRGFCAGAISDGSSRPSKRAAWRNSKGSWTSASRWPTACEPCPSPCSPSSTAPAPARA